MCLVYKKYLNIYNYSIIYIYIMRADQESSAPSPTSPVLVASGHQDQRRRPGPFFNFTQQVSGKHFTGFWTLLLNNYCSPL